MKTVTARRGFISKRVRGGCVGAMALLAVAWVFTVPIVFLVTQDLERIALWPLAKPTRPGLASCYLAVQVLLVPLGLIAGIWAFKRAVGNRMAVCIFCGIVLAMFFNTLFLVLPYLGVYPNLLPAMLAGKLGSGPSDLFRYPMMIMAINVILFGVAGLLLGWEWKRGVLWDAGD